MAVNEEAEQSPSVINRDAEVGWVAKIKVSDMVNNISNLLSGQTARTYINQSEQALRDLMSAQVGAVMMQDGGVPLPGIARHISPEGWEDLVRMFLNPSTDRDPRA